MPRKSTLPHTKKVRAKGRTYLYFVTGQTKPDGKPVLVRLPDPALPSFGATYAAMMGAKTKRENAAADPTELTVPQLADLYERSPKFRKLADGSRRLYRIYLDQLRKEYPTAPAGELERKDMLIILDKRAEKPGAANSLLRVTSALYLWARDREHVKNDPCKEIEEFEVGEHDPWPEHVLAAALASDDSLARLATHLLFYTGQRIGDAVAIKWTALRNGEGFDLTQQKTGKQLWIPLHSALAAELAKRTKSLGTIIAKPNGSPYSQQAVRVALEKFGRSMGVEIVPHGLRKNAVNALLEAGCSTAQTAAITGQSLQMVEHYAKKREQGKLASAAVLQWEGNRP